MAIRVSCPSCNNEMQVDETLAGKDVLCPGCKARVTVPSIAAGRPEARPGGTDIERDEGRGEPRPRDLPRWGDSAEYDMPVRRDTSSWAATVTGLNLVFWTALIMLILMIVYLGSVMAMLPQLVGMVPGAPPPPAAIAFSFLAMGVGCSMLVVFIIWFVGVCMCCTVPVESGAKGRAITMTVLIVLSVVAAIIGMVAVFITAISQAQRMGGPPPPGWNPMAGTPLITMIVVGTIDLVLIVALGLMFHKAVANYFHNERLSRHCVWLLIFFVAASVIGFLLNFLGDNPMLHGGDIARGGVTGLAVVSGLWGVFQLLVETIWYLYINRETRRTILEGTPGGGPTAALD
jgi:hypothetical protein